MGIREALKVLRRHRIIETYLCERLGYAWEDVHEEAERLEHAASDTLVERMAAALKFPSHDPHGAPIPTSAGEIESIEFCTLADAAPGTSVRVRAVRDEDPDRLRFIEAAGLIPGTLVRVGKDARSEGVVTVTVAGEGDVHDVRQELAALIYVVPVGN
jgi:DtxR family Mn-dependent transcriptional regulator